MESTLTLASPSGLAAPIKEERAVASSLLPVFSSTSPAPPQRTLQGVPILPPALPLSHFSKPPTPVRTPGLTRPKPPLSLLAPQLSRGEARQAASQVTVKAEPGVQVRGGVLPLAAVSGVHVDDGVLAVADDGGAGVGRAVAGRDANADVVPATTGGLPLVLRVTSEPSSTRLQRLSADIHGDVGTAGGPCEEGGRVRKMRESEECREESARSVKSSYWSLSWAAFHRVVAVSGCVLLHCAYGRGDEERRS